MSTLKGVVEESHVDMRGVLSTLQEDVRSIQQGLQQLAGAVSSGPKDREWWEVTRKSEAGLGGTAMNGLQGVHTEVQNRFAVLKDEVTGEEDGGVEEQGRVWQGDRREAGPEVLLVGHSQVRYLDQTFCERARVRRVKVCFPGA